jgi:hypothetical protein
MMKSAGTQVFLIAPGVRGLAVWEGAGCESEFEGFSPTKRFSQET